MPGGGDRRAQGGDCGRSTLSTHEAEPGLMHSTDFSPESTTYFSTRIFPSAVSKTNGSRRMVIYSPKKRILRTAESSKNKQSSVCGARGTSMQQEWDLGATPREEEDGRAEDAEGGGACGTDEPAALACAADRRAAVVCVCLVSLLEDSAMFQSSVCREYCIRHGLTVTAILQNHGRAGLETINWEEWRCVISGCSPGHIVFYRLRHVSVAVRELYDAIGIPSVTLHFVQDGLVYGGEFRVPAFRLAPLTMSTETRHKLRDLITLTHMNTCSPSVVNAFVTENFGSFDDLLRLLRSNVVLATMELNRFRLQRTALYRTRRRTVMRWPLHFGDFMKHLQRLRSMFDGTVRDICASMETVSLGSAGGENRS